MSIYLCVYIYVGGPKDLPRDMQRGVKFYMAAAEAGHPQANFNLGALYHGLADVIEHPMLPLRPLGLLLKHEYPLASSWDHRGLKGADKSLITARSSALGPSRHGGNAQTGSASDQVHDQKKNQLRQIRWTLFKQRETCSEQVAPYDYIRKLDRYE